MQHTLAERAEHPETDTSHVDEEVFKRSFIPRNLFEVVDAERDARKLADGDTSGVRSSAWEHDQERGG